MSLSKKRVFWLERRGKRPLNFNGGVICPPEPEGVYLDEYSDVNDALEAAEKRPDGHSEADLWVTPTRGPEALEGLREALRGDVETFLSEGGEIEQIPDGVSGDPDGWD